MIQRIYPSHFKLGSEQEFEMTAKLWERILFGIGYMDCVNALIIYARQQGNKFPPSPSDLIEILEKVHNPEGSKTSELAWEEVSNAIKKFGFHRQSEAFETFDEKTKRVVKNISWWTLCYSERPDMVKRDFCQIWDNLKHAEVEQKMVNDTKWLVDMARKHNAMHKLAEPNN